MQADTPALVDAELGKDEPCRVETAVPVSEGDPNAGVAEADDVGAPVAREVGEHARVHVRAPAWLKQSSARTNRAARKLPPHAAIRARARPGGDVRHLRRHPQVTAERS
jgi:hypothetical protein